MNPANIATMATRLTPRTAFFQTDPSSSAKDLKNTNAAMNKLNNAPTSAASMTLTPTHRPASASRVQRTNHGVSDVLATESASAKNPTPKAISTAATPQQAPAKKVELNMAASAPSMAASGVSFSARKKVHAPRPRMNNATGA